MTNLLPEGGYFTDLAYTEADKLELSVQFDQEPTPLKYTATVSAFYMPNLTELKKQLPPFPKTIPANKENPFQPFNTENNAENQ
ncbi:hypothetical protein [Metabacillus sp. RGM 3146]|uniref:hypothetical protein n=1 Tax=Metabacillus sp. RGM 3146 TaxID=3401092 RepID=UPI003B99ED44